MSEKVRPSARMEVTIIAAIMHGYKTGLKNWIAFSLSFLFHNRAGQKRKVTKIDVITDIGNCVSTIDRRRLRRSRYPPNSGNFKKR
jgi:hypothetical protein